jgi:hypothetical protein
MGLVPATRTDERYGLARQCTGDRVVDGTYCAGTDADHRLHVAVQQQFWFFMDDVYSLRVHHDECHCDWAD